MPLTVLGHTFDTLDQVQEWLNVVKPRGATIVIQGKGRIQAPSTVWTYGREGQTVVIRGGTYVGNGAKGFWLSYRPAVGDGTTRSRPANMPLVIRDVTVSGYRNGGLEVSPTVAVGGNPYEAGNLAWLGAVTVRDSRFASMGTRSGGNYTTGDFGVAGVLARGTTGLRVVRSDFRGLRNGNITGARNGPDLIHGVYARDGSHATVQGNHFQGISGDPLRVSNNSWMGAYGNTAVNSGERAMISDWWNVDANQTGSQIQQHGNRFESLFGGGPVGNLVWRLEG